MFRLIRLLVATIASLTFVHPALSQTAITTCGQELIGDGYLTGDIECGPDDEAAVEVGTGGSLDLRGFSIHGGVYGVLCAEDGPIIDGAEHYEYTPCRVFGGGTVSGQSVVGIVGSKVVLADVTVEGPGIALIIHTRLSFANVTLGPTTFAIMAGPRVHIAGTGLTLIGSPVDVGHSLGFSYGKVKVDGLTVSGFDVLSQSTMDLDLTHASVTGGISGTIGAQKVKLTDSVVTGYSGTAIQARRIKLVRSSVTGNGLDLEAERPPKLKLSTCETSNWDVCPGN